VPTPSPYGALSLPLVIAVGVAMALFFAFVVSKALGAQQTPSVTGSEGMVGRVGTTQTALDPEGMVKVGAERWKAVSEEGRLEMGERVVVVQMEGFRVRVRRAE